MADNNDKLTSEEREEREKVDREREVQEQAGWSVIIILRSGFLPRPCRDTGTKSIALYLEAGTWGS